MQTFQITIPDGVEGKETIEFQLPDGRTVSVEVPAELKAGDRLHVKVPYPEKHNGIVASPPPDNLYRIVADNTKFFSGSKTGHLMYPAFDVADKLVSSVFGWLVDWLTGWLVGWLVACLVEEIRCMYS